MGFPRKEYWGGLPFPSPGQNSGPPKDVHILTSGTHEYVTWQRRIKVTTGIKIANQLDQRRRWHPTPVLLPGKSHGRRSLVGCIPWGREELDTTEWLHFHGLEKEMATHSSVLAWRIPGTGESSGLPSMGSHRVGHNWSNLAAISWIQNGDEQGLSRWAQYNNKHLHSRSEAQKGVREMYLGKDSKANTMLLALKMEEGALSQVR